MKCQNERCDKTLQRNQVILISIQLYLNLYPIIFLHQIEFDFHFIFHFQIEEHQKTKCLFEKISCPFEMSACQFKVCFLMKYSTPLSKLRSP